MSTSRRASPSQPDRSDENARLETLKTMLCVRLEELLDNLGIGLVRGGKKYYGCCPVHGGDNPTALNLYHGGETAPGYWCCHTYRCQNIFGKTILGFVQGVLSHQKYCWTTHRSREVQDKQPIVSFRDTIDYCCEFLGVRLTDIKVDHEEIKRRKFAGEVARLTRGARLSGPGLPREVVRRWLNIPADYFVARGWSREVLDRYDVGLYPAPGKALSHRVAVPIYDVEGKLAVGFTARSIFGQCRKCQRWHDPSSACPDFTDRVAYGRSSKWYNHDFNRDSVLYNWASARKAIEKLGVAALVEGPGDLWRLVEANIECGLGILGATLSEQQQVLLEMSGAMTLIVLTNMDEAGRNAAAELKQRLSRSFRVVVPTFNNKDLGEMLPAAVRELVGPLVEKYTRRF